MNNREYKEPEFWGDFFWDFPEQINIRPTQIKGITDEMWYDATRGFKHLIVKDIAQRIASDEHRIQVIDAIKEAYYTHPTGGAESDFDYHKFCNTIERYKQEVHNPETPAYLHLRYMYAPNEDDLFKKKVLDSWDEIFGVEPTTPEPEEKGEDEFRWRDTDEDILKLAIQFGYMEKTERGYNWLLDGVRLGFLLHCMFKVFKGLDLDIPMGKMAEIFTIKDKPVTASMMKDKLRQGKSLKKQVNWHIPMILNLFPDNSLDESMLKDMMRSEDLFKIKIKVA